MAKHRLDHLYPPSDQRRTPVGVVIHICTMCGQEFLLRSSLMRHRALELPGFQAVAKLKNLAYETSRKRHLIEYERTHGRPDDVAPARERRLSPQPPSP